MAKKKPSSDFNTDVVVALRKVTGTKRQKGESLIGDPKLRKAYREALKKAKG